LGNFWRTDRNTVRDNADFAFPNSILLKEVRHAAIYALFHQRMPDTGMTADHVFSYFA